MSWWHICLRDDPSSDVGAWHMVLGRYRFMLESQGITWGWAFLSSASQIPSVITPGILWAKKVMCMNLSDASFEGREKGRIAFFTCHLCLKQPIIPQSSFETLGPWQIFNIYFLLLLSGPIMSMVSIRAALKIIWQSGFYSPLCSNKYTKKAQLYFLLRHLLIYIKLEIKPVHSTFSMVLWQLMG